MLYLDGGKPAVFLANGSVTVQASSPITANVWHYLAATYDASLGVAYLYVDGFLVAAQSVTENQSNSTANMLVGADSVKGKLSNFLNGNVGRVAVWSEARTEEAVLNDGLPSGVFDPIAQETLELFVDFSVAPAVDQSGNDNPVTFQAGANYTITIPGLSLSGSGQYASVGSGHQLDRSGDKSYTIEGWFYRNAAGTHRAVAQVPRHQERAVARAAAPAPGARVTFALPR